MRRHAANSLPEGSPKGSSAGYVDQTRISASALSPCWPNMPRMNRIITRLAVPTAHFDGLKDPGGIQWSGRGASAPTYPTKSDLYE